MKRILVPIFSKEPNFWASVHAMQLSERIDAKVYLMEFIEDDSASSKDNTYVSRDCGYLKFLNLNKKEGKNVHIRVNGNFLTKCTKFIAEHGIDLVVLSIPNKTQYRHWVLDLIKTINKQKLCRVEIVKKIKKRKVVNMFHMYLPIAGNSINVFLILGLGGLVGLLSGIFGVGGGFLMTPLLIMFGIPPTVAAASDSNQIVGASTSGTVAHYRLGNVDIKMGILLLIGGIIGGDVGVHIIKVLRALGNADFLINITYVIMLGFVGTYMFIESLQSLRKSKEESKVDQTYVSTPQKESIYIKIMNSLPFQTHFEKSGVTMSALMPLILGVFVGILAAIMGVGGGFIMVPVMVYLLRMPMHVVVGTSLFQILFTCINVTIMQAYSNHTVDFVLALCLLLGSTVGAQFGTRISKRLKGDQLKIILATIVLLVMFKMLYSLLAKPSLMLSYAGGH